VLGAEAAKLLQLKLSRGVFLVLRALVVALLALGAGERYLVAHLLSLLAAGGAGGEHLFTRLSW
jgi:hypothetical protein